MRRVVMLARLFSTIIFIAVLSFSIPARATVILDDEFTNLAKVDLSRTTAYVNPSGGYVSLKKQAKPNAVAMNRFGEYAVTTLDGIRFFSYDDATGGAREDATMSPPGVTDAEAIALPADGSVMWAYRPGGIYRYEHNDSSGEMSETHKVLGVLEVLSITAYPEADDGVGTLRKSNAGAGVVDVYQVTEGDNLVVAFSFDTGITDPVAISFIPGTGEYPDFLYCTSTTLYFFYYDESIDNYQEDVSMRTSLASAGAVSVSASRDGNGALTPTLADHYAFSDEVPKKVSVLSAGPLTGAIAISLNPYGYDQAIVTESGDVQYWYYDESTDSLKRDASMEQTGLRLSGGYIHPGEYRSVILDAGDNYDELRIIAQTDLPAGTSISFYVSSDGGVTFTSANNGAWTPVPAGRNFVVRAVLDTTDKDITPLILNIKLEITTLNIIDLQIRAIACNEVGQPLPVMSFPATVKAGAEIQLQVSTSGYAEALWGDFTTGEHVVFTPVYPITDDLNDWRGLYTVPIDAQDGDLIGVTITAERGGKQKHLTQYPLVRVQGKISYVSDLQLTQ